METVLERKRRLARERQRRRTASLNEQQRESRREAHRQQFRNLSQDLRQQRISQVIIRNSERQLQETKEQTDNRREIERQRRSESLRNETRENATNRRSNLRRRASQRIQNETEEETEARREDLRRRASQRIENETEEEAEARREDLRRRASQRVQNETEEETEARREIIRLVMQERTRNENINEMHNRQLQNANRMRARRNGLQNQFRVNNIEYIEENVQKHNCGAMTAQCQFCEALHFNHEKPSDGRFNNCCHKGKLLPPLRREFPPYLKSLLTDRNHIHHDNFKRNIRSYNSAVSFASMGAQIVDPQGHGPYCFRVHGQIYHRTSHMHPAEDQRRQFAQLYVVDSEEATAIRVENEANVRCIPEVMENLDIIVRQNNVFAQSYKTLRDVEQEEEERSRNEERALHIVNLTFNRDRNADRRRYNLPSVNEIAMVFHNEEGEPPFNRDFRVYPMNLNNQIINLNILSPNLEPMTYVLFFPFGEPGWQPHMIGNIENGRKNISMLQYKISQLAIRENEFNSILYGGKLFQQWAVDSYLQVEANNLNFVKSQQLKLRAEQYQGLADHLSNIAENVGVNVGRKVILPSSFQGSPRNMRERYQDAMVMVSKHGPPDIFLTATCNPNWPEIKENLYPGQTPSDRPDLVARIFNLKLKELMDDIMKKNIFGKVEAYCYSIEFQKRGLPHVHLLIILHSDDKPSNPARINEIVCAEIPNHETEPILLETIKKCMIHGPCGEFNPNAPCMLNGRCQKKFPKNLQQETVVNNNGYPLYKRHPDASLQIGQHTVDNRFVVPYNKYLCKKYDCHINVEVCNSVKSVKYIYKYVYKGYDSINLNIREAGANNDLNYDEVRNHLDARYVSAPESMWRLLEYKMYCKSHHVIRLPVHLPQEQLLYFEEGEERNALERAAQRNTPLTAYFLLNQEDENASQFYYIDIPYHYVFDKRTCLWKLRERGKDKVIARLYTVHPRDEERFYLRLLLFNVKGAHSFENLRTVNGNEYNTYKEAADKRNLINNDDEWQRCMEEAAVAHMPRQLRQLFAFICIFNNPIHCAILLETFCVHLIEDFTMNNTHEVAMQKALKDINSTLLLHGMNCHELGLPMDDNFIDAEYNDANEHDAGFDIERLIASLTVNQTRIFEQIVTAIDDDQQHCRFFFLDGPGGTGKTYLYNALISYLNIQNKRVLSYATTGIAADLLINGRTVHSGMKLPVPILDTSTSTMRIPSEHSEKLKMAHLIIVDEASMLSRNGLRIIDALLQELMNSNRPFGGKVLLLGGDFRQTAPVIRRASNAAVIESSIKKYHWWRNVTKLSLTENMRIAGQIEYNNWLLQLGNGILSNNYELPEDIIELPQDMLSSGNIVADIFGDAINVEHNTENIASRIILTPKNIDALKLNYEIMSLLPGEVTNYKSIDSISSDDTEVSFNYPIEFVNSITPSGMPPHELKLKKGCIIMLIRNLNPHRGLLNGTRLIIISLNELYIHSKILSGSKKGEQVFIPRINLSPSDADLPFVMTRRQFPVIPAFAMTINKSQGQSFDQVGVYLPAPVFSHGQLYVALSRSRNRHGIKIFVTDSDSQGKLLNDGRVFTRNIVLKKILD